jgi:hypothetical protein
MAENEHSDRLVDRVEVGPSRPVRRVELEDRSSLVVIESAGREDGRRAAALPPLASAADDSLVRPVGGHEAHGLTESHRRV